MCDTTYVIVSSEVELLSGVLRKGDLSQEEKEAVEVDQIGNLDQRRRMRPHEIKPHNDFKEIIKEEI